MRRRAFISLLVTGLPVAVRAQQRAAQKTKPTQTIGVVWPNPRSTFEYVRQGLSDLGYVEGRNIRFEFRSAEDRLSEIPEIVAELVRLKVDLILTLAPPAAFAAKKATQTIPIVFVAIGDPLAGALVASLSRPGGNLTGTTRMLSETSAKSLALLKEALPSLSRVAVLWNPANLSHPTALKAVQATARSVSLQLQPFEARTPADISAAFDGIHRQRVDGLLLLADPLFFVNLKRIVDLSATERLPTATNWTELPEAGGLLGYASSIADEFRHAASHIDKILKGANPGDLPVEQPTQFELVLNLKTAKALGLTISQALLARADRVIE
jgi:putative tryptophan/tyrosine transport system substrate-binding protein